MTENLSRETKKEPKRNFVMKQKTYDIKNPTDRIHSTMRMTEETPSEFKLIEFNHSKEPKIIQN